MIVYSKGLPDVLELLLRYPKIFQHIAPIISIAGASNGSPYADEIYEFYRIGLPGCRCRVMAEGQARKFET